ncbi:hypothetical protein C8Q76DRAFT_695027 [Earliella scabrosa]|nr:hypothetical protein C8Q76DRAFT_695027 [Earliella scabrosa]
MEIGDVIKIMRVSWMSVTDKLKREHRTDQAAHAGQQALLGCGWTVGPLYWNAGQTGKEQTTLNSDKDLQDNLGAQHAHCLSVPQHVLTMIKEAYRTLWSSTHSMLGSKFTASKCCMVLQSSGHPTCDVDRSTFKLQVNFNVMFTVWSDNDDPPMSLTAQEVQLQNFEVSSYAYPKCTINTQHPR